MQYVSRSNAGGYCIHTTCPLCAVIYTCMTAKGASNTSHTYVENSASAGVIYLIRLFRFLQRMKTLKKRMQHNKKTGSRKWKHSCLESSP